MNEARGRTRSARARAWLIGAWVVALSALAAILSLPRSAEGATPDQIGAWGPVLNWGIQGKHMAMLPTGSVLVWSTGANARVWDPASGSFTQVPDLFGDIHCSGQATLGDGRVIVIGGQNGSPHVGIRVVSIFDPFTNTWTQGAPMANERWYPTATILPDGRLLASSGDNASGVRITVPELYDPVSNTWTQLTGAARTQSLYPFMYVLPNGRIYEAGTNASTALLDLSGTGSWTPGPTNGFGSSGYAESSATYAPGKIIRSGGGDPAIARAAIVDMTAASPQWEELSPMAFPRRRHNMVILADGTVMAVGGTRQADLESQAVLEGEIWNPATKLWTTVAAMSEARMYHSSAVLLPDGRVLSAGGEATGRLHAQIYSPPYLFKGPRPTITSSPGSASYGTSFTVGTPDAAGIASVALIRTGAATHAFDHNQRYVPLSFAQSGGGLTVTAPASGNIAPPGYYMLVIKNANGVPSVASWIRIDSSTNLQPGTITGKVTDAGTAAAISGATVSSNGGSTTTNATGDYTLTNVPAGDHVVTVEATGYATASRAQTITGGGTFTLNFALSLPGTITGTVTDNGSGNAIAAATITFSGGTTTTDVGGHYTIAGIASGSQTIAASATGYDSAQQPVIVPANGSVTANFALAPTQTFIAGQVIDNVTTEPIVGATVSYGGGSTTTDSLGRYRLDNTLPGTYAVVASASGYTSVSHQVVVTAGAFATSDFALDPVPVGARIKDITFEGGSLTDPTSGADSVAGTVALETAAPLKGGFAARIANASASYLEERFAAADDLFASFYLRVNALPAADARIALLSDAGTTVANLQLTTTGRLRLRVGSTTIGESAPLGVGELYRIGIHQKKGTGANAVAEAFLSEGDAAFGVPYAAATTGAWTTQADRLRVGATNPSIVNVVVDDIRLDTGSMPPPSSGPPPPPPAAPTADFTGTPTAGPAPLTVAFSDASTGSPTSWSWDFGDGGTSTLQNTSHTYTSAGSYTVKLTATNAGGATTKTKTGYIAVNPGGTGSALTFAPVADAQVKSTSATTNYGPLTSVRVRQGTTASPSTYHSFLKFSVSGLTGSVTAAKLRLFVTDPSPSGGSVYQVGNDWTESGITWSNAPALGATPLASAGATTLGTWVEISLPASIFAAGNVTYSFALASTSTNSAIYSSKEGANPPQLVLTQA